MSLPKTPHSILRETTISISTEDRAGSGFFVSPHHIITCAHVVASSKGRPAAHINGIYGGKEVPLKIIEHTFKYASGLPDLVLLEIEDDDSEHAYAALGPQVAVGDDLWIWGYPQGPYHQGDSAVLQYHGTFTRQDNVELLRADGIGLSAGFSGSPVLNSRTGAVCGLIRLGEPSSQVIRLTPAEVILKIFADHLRRYHQPPFRNTSWLDLLDDNQLQAGNFAYPGPWMRNYLAAVQAAVQSHPYAVSFQNAPPLTSVYLRQRGVNTHHAQSDDSTIDLPGPNRRAAGYSADSDELFIRHRNSLITGRPGSGKSSLLRYVADESSGQWLDNRVGKFVPVYVQASELVAGNPFARAISDATNRELATWIDDEFQRNGSIVSQFRGFLG